MVNDVAVNAADRQQRGASDRKIHAVVRGALLGVGIGALVGDQTAAITLALMGVLVLEPLLGLAGDTAGHGGPMASAQALSQSSAPDSDHLSPVVAGLMMAGYAATALVLGLLRNERREVATG